MANITILEALNRSLTSTKSYIDKIAATKVDKVDGKGLSTNDLTDTLKSNYETAYAHSQAAHAPVNAQKNSDITKAEIEAKLTGDITSHTHSQYLTSVPAEYITETELTDKGYAPLDSPNFTNSISMGRKSDTTIGVQSVALGYNTTASGTASYAEGVYTTASGTASHALGYSTTASGYASHAEGESSNLISAVISDFSSSTTNNTIITTWNTKKFSLAKGIASHIEGKDNLALGETSHAEGNSTIAKGNCSHAEGYWTKASGQYQHVQGKYNIKDDANTYAHIVGNGTADNTRSNAHTLDWNGNAWFAGKVTVGTAPTENMDVATKQYVDDAIANGGRTSSRSAADYGPYSIQYNGGRTSSRSAADYGPYSIQYNGENNRLEFIYTPTN